MKSGEVFRRRKLKIFLHQNRLRNISTNQNTRRILFVAEDVTLAHVTRPLVLANSLDKNRYEIHFATGNNSRRFVGEFEGRFHSIPTLSSALFIDRLAKGKPVYRLDELRSFVQADLDLLRTVSPDLVVGDFRLSLGISAEVAGIPYAALANGHWSPYSTALFPLPEHTLVSFFGAGLSRVFLKFILPLIFKYHAAAFNSLRKAYGLKSVSGLKEMYTHGTWSLYLDLPCLAPTADAPTNHFYLGPVLWSPEIPYPVWWNTIPEDKPVIYVTLGSSGDINTTDALFKVFGEMPFTVLMASAGRFDNNQLPKNIFLEKFIPGLEASQRASLVICSGGSATVYQALACGTPVIGLPSNADQYFTMESVVREGAGVLIRSGEITETLLKKAAIDILGNADYKRAAARLSGEMQKYSAPERFSAFLNSLNGE